MSKEIFSIADQRFRVFQKNDGSLWWEGNYCGIEVIQALPVDYASKCLILLDTLAKKKPSFDNLLCVGQDGKIVWEGELPESHDTFVHFEKVGEGLVANTWSGYRVRLDPATGKILHSEFVK